MGKGYENTSKFGGAGNLTEWSIRTLRTLLPAPAPLLVKEARASVGKIRLTRWYAQRRVPAPGVVHSRGGI